MLNNINTIIFDMDGTLIDSMGVWPSIDRKFFAEHNLVFTEQYFKDIEGLSIDENADYVISKYHLSYTPEKLISIWNNMATEYYSNEVNYKTGALEFLKYLKNNNYKIGIATSNSRELVKNADERLHFSKYIDVIVTSNEVPHGKPAPDIFLKVAEHLNSKPENCLVYEDIPNGLIAAKAAGMKTCAIFDDFSKHLDSKKKAIADYYIKDYTEIPM